MALSIVTSVGRVLRGQPFMATRRQQLSYRVMLMQGFLVAVLLGLAVGMDLYFLVRHVVLQQTVEGANGGFSMVSTTVYIRIYGLIFFVAVLISLICVFAS